MKSRGHALRTAWLAGGKADRTDRTEPARRTGWRWALLLVWLLSAAGTGIAGTPNRELAERRTALEQEKTALVYRTMFSEVGPAEKEEIRGEIEKINSQLAEIEAQLAAGQSAKQEMVADDTCLSPTALAATKDGRTLFVACATANRVLRLELASRRVIGTIPVPARPTGLALSAGDGRLFVTCAGSESQVCIVDVAQNRIEETIPAGHTAMAPVVSPDQKTLFVCNRFNNDVSVIDLGAKKELRRIPVRREPMAADITPDGKYLLVANALPTGPATAHVVSAVVSVISVADGAVVRDLRPPSGSTSLLGLRVSPDGSYAAVTHVLCHFRLPAETVERGWMNVNVLTLIDVRGLQIVNTVMLDEPRSGAANPWGVAWSVDGATLAVAHAGAHQVSLINFPGLLAKLLALPADLDTPRPADFGPFARLQSEVPNDLFFLSGLRQRVTLPDSDRGPRAVVIAGNTACTANYFSDSLSTLPLGQTNAVADSIPLSATNRMSLVRQGELWFHDGTRCYQGWQSCSSCHPGDARVDGLNWDLLNDGRNNPKNTKSLLLVHQTPPAMSLGVRDTAETAVRAGMQHILFTKPSESVAAAIDAYLKSLKPVSSPFLVQSRLSDAARRGREVFQRAGCAVCHPPGLFTDLNAYNVGTWSRGDQPEDEYDTPTLVELWRTAPYLHDGSAATARDVLTTHNRRDQHGRTSKLTERELEDLCAYLLSL